VFVNSMSDLFHEDVPIEFIDRVFATMYDCQWHQFQVLTKRPQRAAMYFQHQGAVMARIAKAAWGQMQTIEPEKAAVVTADDIYQDIAESWPLKNVCLGVSAEDQKRWDERVPLLAMIPATIRFVSVEPMLSAIDIHHAENMRSVHKIRKIHWIICGGESGHDARPMHPAWPRVLRDQCQHAGVPFFFKQWGEWQDGSGTGLNAVVLTNGRAVIPDIQDGRRKLCDELGNRWDEFFPTIVSKVGKSAAGRLLDGREWNEMPEVSLV